MCVCVCVCARASQTRCHAAERLTGAWQRQLVTVVSHKEGKIIKRKERKRNTTAANECAGAGNQGRKNNLARVWCVCVCVCVCVCACVRACVRACVCVCVRFRLSDHFLVSF